MGENWLKSCSIDRWKKNLVILELPHNQKRRGFFMHRGAFVDSDIRQKSLNCKCQQDVALSDISQKDKKWDVHRQQADSVQQIYGVAREFERLAQRISDCSGILRFGKLVEPETGEISFKLKHARFCRVRHCPVCQWRRSLMWQARFHMALPEALKAHTEARWLFLTLTVRNCEISALRANLQEMGKAWQRLIKRKAFQAIKGWLRTTEVTRGLDGTAHPHFHVLLMVRPSYFKKNYVSQAAWVELWQKSMRLNYSPNLDIRRVKGRKNEDDKEALRKAVVETLKYAVKPSDMIENEEWFLELTRQVHQLRFVASGGALKNILKESQETNQDLITESNTSEIDGNNSSIAFDWRENEKRYRRFEQGDTF